VDHVVLLVVRLVDRGVLLVVRLVAHCSIGLGGLVVLLLGARWAGLRQVALAWASRAAVTSLELRLVRSAAA